jgi:hypothetical protein
MAMAMVIVKKMKHRSGPKEKVPLNNMTAILPALDLSCLALVVVEH